MVTTCANPPAKLPVTISVLPASTIISLMPPVPANVKFPEMVSVAPFVTRIEFPDVTLRLPEEI